MNDELSYQFVDTNVLVYAYDATAGPKRERANALLTELWQSGTGCLSIQVLQEFYVTITRKISTPLDEQIAAQVIEDISSWRIHVPDARSILSAIDIHRRQGISFWDAMIVHSAAELGCQIIWSEDLNPGQVYEGITLINPFLA